MARHVTQNAPDAVTRRIVMPDGRTKVVKHIEVSPDKAKVWRKQADDGAEETFIRIPVSSTSRDRDGDSFTQEGLQDLKAQFDTGKIPVFFDHGYKSGMDFIPHYGVRDIRGRWDGAEFEGETLFATARGRMLRDRETGKRFTDPEFAEVADMVEDGNPVAASVGFFEVASEAAEGSDYARDFTKTDLVETSFVGIPSNPDAVNGVVSLLAKAHGVSESRLLKVFSKALSDSQGKGGESMVETEQGKQEEKEDQEAEKAQTESGGEDETPDAPESPGEITNEVIAEKLDALPGQIASALADALAKRKEGDDEEEEEDEDKKKDEDKDKAASKRNPQPPSKNAPDESRGPRGIATIPDTQDSPEGEHEEKTLEMNPTLRIIPHARTD